MSSRAGSSIRPVKSRRRDEALMSAIRDATRAELADFGYGGVTFEGVARRAQTSKPVLYRRYSSRAHMVVDALPTLQWQPGDEFTWTQSLRDDLLLIFGVATEKIHAFGVDNYRSLIAEANADVFGALDALVTGLAERTVLPALERARQRGELGPREIPRRAALSIGVLVRNEMLFSRDTVNANIIANIVDTVYLPLMTVSSYASDGPGRNLLDRQR